LKRDIDFGLLLHVAVHSICSSIETKAENKRLETKQFPAIQRNLTKNTIDYGAQSKTQILTNNHG
jgi:hypothetical protein